ncbi:DUF411 domain-containing protein [Parahaliea sp. F7430]|uniref:DUF411 domain-containing protein n=2 Tax=Sediminihaliea albiluteola TaxID=2758564 RepID=A0A7W2TUD0_9GAMM|nr:DUF411 domain-containing protein [Sediminihaliea albiluteola]
MKHLRKCVLQLSAISALLLSLAACSEQLDSAAASTEKAQANSAVVSLDVYKSPTCGCCGKWMEHADASGFETLGHHPVDLNQFKIDKGITAPYQSCHTAVSQEGYVFEGHIPADIIHRFLANPPANALGLVVPGMPVGSPGMEVGSRQDEYAVLVLYKDGSDDIYEHIGSAQ